MTNRNFTLVNKNGQPRAHWRSWYWYITECPKIYRKSVLNLLKYRFAVYLSRCSTDLRKIFGHPVDGNFKHVAHA